MDAERENELIRVVNDQKGQIMAMQSLVMALVRGLEIDTQANVLAQWDIETESAKTVLLNSAAPEELVQAYDRYVAMFDALRRSHREG